MGFCTLKSEFSSVLKKTKSAFLKVERDGRFLIFVSNLRNINRLFVLSFKNGDDNPTINYFHEYYMPLVEVKDFNALIDSKKQTSSE